MSICILAWLIVGFLRIKFLAKDVDGWLTLYWYNVPALSLFLRFLCMVFWPYPKFVIWMTNTFLDF